LKDGLKFTLTFRRLSQRPHRTERPKELSFSFGAYAWNLIENGLLYPRVPQLSMVREPDIEEIAMDPLLGNSVIFPDERISHFHIGAGV